MVTSPRSLAASLLALGVLIAAPACATGGYGYGAAYPDYRVQERRAYDNGFREGLRNGERDAYERRSFRVDRDRAYRTANDGFYRQGAYSLEQYRQMFRRGYEAGYAEGYSRRGGAYGGGSRGYPGGVVRPPYGGAPGNAYVSSAARNGYDDGLEAGRDDARARRSFDPRRPRSYREGDQGYSSRDGSRDDYKRDYRAAFQQGYEQGYRGY